MRGSARLIRTLCLSMQCLCRYILFVSSILISATFRRALELQSPITSGSHVGRGMAMNNDKETSESKRTVALQDKVNYCDCIIATLREPFIVLDHDLRIKTANRSFYVAFRLSPEETENQLIYDLDNHQWGIPGLRELLERVLKDERPVHDFEVEHDFPAIGRKIMLLNARRFESVESPPNLILLAIEDITERKQAEVAVQTSEVRYRRLFETAKDGILILDANTLKIIDANPFMTELLGYSHDEFLGKELWEIGLFRDKQESQAAYPRTAREGLYPLRPPAARNQRRGEGRSRVRQQRLSGGPPASRSVQHSGHQRTQPLGAEDEGAGGSVGRPAPPQGRVPGDAFP